MAGSIEIVITEEFKKAFTKLPRDIKKKVRKQQIVDRYGRN